MFDRLVRHVVTLSQREGSLLSNAGALVGATAINAGLGFVYWWLAARSFPQSEVGMASAAVSAMMLLATIGMLGMGTLLLGELPRKPGREIGLISIALTAAGLSAGILGVGFALATPLFATDLAALAATPGSVLLFASGVALTSISLVLDQALVGLLRGGLQIRRNGLFALSKLGILAVLGLAMRQGGGLAIYATWVLGLAISLGGVALASPLSLIRKDAFRPPSGALQRLGGPALLHHALNLVLQAPSLLMPVIVTAMLSATLNASFYVALMINSLVFVSPAALATVLYSLSAGDPAALGRRLRLNLLISLLIGLAANGALWVAGGWVLRLFGQSYATQAQVSLSLMALGVFPFALKQHFVAIERIHGRIGRAALIMAVGGALELGLAAGGAQINGLVGLSLGWLAGLTLEALVAVPTVWRYVRLASPSSGPEEALT